MLLFLCLRFGSKNISVRSDQPCLDGPGGSATDRSPAKPVINWENESTKATSDPAHVIPDGVMRLSQQCPANALDSGSKTVICARPFFLDT